MTRSINWWLVLSALVLTAAIAACSSDDGDDADTDTDTGSEADTNDSDTGPEDTGEDTNPGELAAEMRGATVQVYDGTLGNTTSTVGCSVRWTCSGGVCTDVVVTEMRVYLGDDTEVFFEVPDGAIQVVDELFDGDMASGDQIDVSYNYISSVQNGFNDHCTEGFHMEIDYTVAGSDPLTLTYGIAPQVATVTCLTQN